jgi:hypothetical protein
MSLEVLLIPFGIAAVAAIREARSTSLCEGCRATNVADQSLLVAALAELKTERLVQFDGRVTCRSTFGQLTFQRIGGVFLGRVDNGTSATTLAMVEAVSSAAGGLAQRQMIRTVQERAAGMGLTLVSEATTDGSVQLVYEVAP